MTEPVDYRREFERLSTGLTPNHEGLVTVIERMLEAGYLVDLALKLPDGTYVDVIARFRSEPAPFIIQPRDSHD